MDANPARRVSIWDIDKSTLTTEDRSILVWGLRSLTILGIGLFSLGLLSIAFGVMVGSGSSNRISVWYPLLSLVILGASYICLRRFRTLRSASISQAEERDETASILQYPRLGSYWKVAAIGMIAVSVLGLGAYQLAGQAGLVDSNSDSMLGSCWSGVSPNLQEVGCEDSAATYTVFSMESRSSDCGYIHPSVEFGDGRYWCLELIPDKEGSDA